MANPALEACCIIIQLRTGTHGFRLFAGHDGWHDDIAERRTLSYLADLAAGDCYERELLLAYEEGRSAGAMERLEKIAPVCEEIREMASPGRRTARGRPG